MNLLVVFCTHQTSSLTTREQLAFGSGETLAQGYTRLRATFHDIETLIVSTCNRVELYFAAPSSEEIPHPEQVAQFLSEFHCVPVGEFANDLRSKSGLAVVQHLFSVVSSLDSMVLGEPQIVSQVKDAYRAADAAGCCGPLLHMLIQNAIRVSSRIRTETRLAEGRVSIASVAVGEFARSIFDTFADKRVVVIGAGEMAEETVRYLQDADGGVQELIVVNRSLERAQRLASTWGGLAAGWDELDHWLAQADVIVSTTGAEQPIIGAPRFQAARALARRRRVVILDLAAPRDFGSEIGQFDDVFLYDIDSLTKVCDENRRARAREISEANKILEAECETFRSEWNRRSGGEVVSRLRDEWTEVSQNELERLFRKMPGWTDSDRDAARQCVHRIVNKLLHRPLEAIKDEARNGKPHGLLTAMKRLFRLDD